MKIKTICSAALVIIFIALSSCSTVPHYKASKTVEPDGSYVVTRFQGPQIDLSLVELNDREGAVLVLKNTDRIQIVPVPPGEYAIRKIAGDRPPLASMLLGPAKYYIAIPLDLMRVITVSPGDSVYIGELDLRRTVDLNPMVDGVVRYAYDPVLARDEYEDLYGNSHSSLFIGFAD